MNNTVTLQVPMKRELKDAAESAAYDHGFSSLQEMVRVMLKKLSTNEMIVHFSSAKPVILSKKAKKRYAKAIADIKAGKNIVASADAKDFLNKLRS